MRVAIYADVLSILPIASRALVLLTALLCGCDANTAVTPLFQNIVNGVPTTQHRAVVQLRMHLNGGQRMYCSGSLVGRDRVLTAAHCLPDYFWMDDAPRKLERVDVYFGSDASQPAVSGGWPTLREAIAWERNPAALLRDKLPTGDAGIEPETEMDMEPDAGPPRPAFGVEAYVGRYDTAIVYLKEPAPETIQPLNVRYELPTPKQLAELDARIVGFGATGVRADGTLIGTGIKREGTPRIIGPSELTDDLDLYTQTLTIAAAEGDAAAGCKEDSGGPLLMQFGPDDWQIIAVTSWGENRCDGEVHYASIAESAAFLRERIPAP